MRKILPVLMSVIFVWCSSYAGDVVIADSNAATRDTKKTEIAGYENWPVLKSYDRSHLARIALPIGGIGTGTVSLGGRGDLRDWEIMNIAAKDFVPSGDASPFFAIYTRTAEGKSTCRALEGPVEPADYEGSHGCTVPNAGLPRFRNCSFAAAYPLGQVMLSDPDVPVDVRLKAFNPLIPGDANISGIPVAVLRYILHNKTDAPLTVSVCGNMPNFIGMDGSRQAGDWKGDPLATGGTNNHNHFRTADSFQGIFMDSNGVDPNTSQWGTIALATTAKSGVTFRTGWPRQGWSGSLLDFWDDFSDDGKLQQRQTAGQDKPMASLAVELELPANATKEVTFLITWHFPNRYTWTPRYKNSCRREDLIGNYYTTQYKDAWNVIEKVVPQVDKLESQTVRFVRAFCESTLPEEVKEAALFNVSTLRTQTCFRTTDGRFYGWEGSSNTRGCCEGSCTHVWNYEQATAFLFGGLAKSMREVEFGHATAENGLMSYRVHLPLERAKNQGIAAADGQMGCIMKMYRDWQLSGDDQMLKTLWPNVKKAVEFCWIKNGWDADRNGVMEGCQHNTMDVEYYGPNPEIGTWYLGALRAAEEMARYVGDDDFAKTCRSLFENGKKWTDENLFNGEYYEQKIMPPKSRSDVAKGLTEGAGAKDATKPDYQIGAGCLADQLVGQYMAHICNLGYLLEPANVRTTLLSIMKYNLRNNSNDNFNFMRSFALGDEPMLLVASFPKGRPEKPFPYYPEAWPGLEYVAAAGMLYEGQTENGLACIRNVRSRFDGLKRSPFDEAECGHHYARSMASWATVIAFTGFGCSAVEKSMTFAPQNGSFFWSNGYAWGNCSLKTGENDVRVELSVLHGELTLSKFILRNFGIHQFDKITSLKAEQKIEFTVPRK